MSQSYSLSYGKEQLHFIFPEGMSVDWIAPQFVDGDPRPDLAISQALDHPIGGMDMTQFRGAKTAAIAVNDKTRPVPLHLLLPPLIQRLNKLGIASNRIEFIFATGTHAPLTKEEMTSLLPHSIAEGHHFFSHNCDDEANFLPLGSTSRGTKVLCSRQFLQADLKIVTGNIEPHHFAGFSGGYKTFSIGLAGRETINHNHSMLLDDNARTGEFERNPLRQDIEEIGRMAGIDLALNVILNEKKEIVQAFAGSPADVIHAGIPVARQVCQTPVNGLYDLVIASVGGHPKDINLYQAQKALTHASMLTRDGGAVILVAACPEGSGSQGFEELMTHFASPSEVFERFDRVDFRVGPHKAFQFARELVRIRVILLSEMPRELVRRLYLLPAQSPVEAMQMAFDFLPANPRIAVIPRAINTIPLPI